VEVERGIYDDWCALGCLTTALGETTGRTLVEHPLIAAYLRASAATAKLADQLGIASRVRKSVGGRPIGAVSPPDRVAARNGTRGRLTLARPEE